jgi:alpha-1,2-mannosyltransferase
MGDEAMWARDRWLFIAVYVVSAVVVAASVCWSNLIDLSVYTAGGRAILDGAPLYSTGGIDGLPFTYTPFAAVMFVPLALMGPLGPVLVTSATVAALARVSFLIARVLAPATDFSVLRVAHLIFLFGILSEPLTETLRLGQVNAVVLWMVVEALTCRQGSRRVALLGIAAAIKLTPLAFIGLLVISRRWKDAALSGSVFLATVGAGWLVQPEEAHRYWTELVGNASRIGGVSFVGNQSLNGSLWRLLGPGGSRPIWMAGSLLLVLGCYFVATRAQTARQWLAAFGAVGLTSLLASPISWSHHWVMALPALATLCFAPIRALRWFGYGGVVLLLSRAIWTVPNRDDVEYQHHGFQLIVGNAYVLYGALAVIATLWWSLRGTERVPGSHKSSIQIQDPFALVPLHSLVPVTEVDG